MAHFVAHEKGFRNLIFLFFLSSRAHKIQGQFTEEQILDNNENSPMFEEFLQLLGDKVRLRGFDKYKGGLGKKKFA
jgi:Rap/ran-GAP